ncbi:MAG TPA: CHAD domain-containing protein [Verrucomicrobiae bacterium]
MKRKLKDFKPAGFPAEQLTAALNQIGWESFRKSLKLAEKIHSVRVQCKRSRALLVLLRPYISASEYTKGKESIKAAGHELTLIRDVHVLQDTLDSAADEFGKRKHRKHRRSIAFNFPSLDDRLERKAYRHSRDRLRNVLADLPTPTRGPTDLLKFSLPGLRNSYRKAHKGMLRSRKHSDFEVFHQWRKSVKCLFSQLELLNRAGLHPNVTVLESLDAFQRDLGRHRDLVLAEKINRTEQQVSKRLLRAIRRRRKRLQKNLRRRGKGLFRRTDREFLKHAFLH